MFFRGLRVRWLALLAGVALGIAPFTGTAQAALLAQTNRESPMGRAADVQPLPPLKARVTDLTGTLSEQQRDALEARLAALEAAKGAQVAVLLAPTFQPESIEQYGIRLAETWRLGRKGVDDGAILLIAKDDRQMRIEVGYGLEGALNDATAKRIISEVITPYFQAGDYYAGIDAGVNAMQAVIEGEPLPAPRASGSRGGATGGADRGANDAGQFLPLLAVAAVLAQGLNRLLGLGGSLLAAGAVVVIGGWLLGSWMGGLLLGVLVLIFSFMRGGHGMGGMGRGGGSGGFGGGGWSGGGGGGFGGGGASGRW